MSASPNLDARIIPSAALLAHWQGHRRLTRRVIEAFPDDKFATFSIGGVRTFAALAGELLAMTAPTVQGVVTDEWAAYAPAKLETKAEVLAAWDAATKILDEYWPRITAERFAATITMFGAYTGITYDLLLYIIDNEIHHRAQGYVYLRALGIEPPAFYDRT
ncbi:MAG: DinB family protein [Proteobacteria bacterium]|nr:DinB family protein [Pseudomonadota bacterium]